uniref:Uncharacterized protein n=1 Tax=Anguilla anguilla TaxID=7936 RepID=A0A0E9XP02_ANGAN
MIMVTVMSVHKLCPLFCFSPIGKSKLNFSKATPRL